MHVLCLSSSVDMTEVTVAIMVRKVCVTPDKYGCDGLATEQWIMNSFEE
jgi:hypothetical protein